MAHLNRKEATNLINRRHPEYGEHEKRWRFLQDSYEGGNRYRYANYLTDPLTTEEHQLWYVHGWDVATSVPYTIAFNQYVDVNLVPHLSEMNKDGRDLYALRLARTPVPDDFRRVVEQHLARIYGREPIRDTPDARLAGWWEDVDGERTTIDRWMSTVVGPLLLTLGQLDLCFDHPPAPEGAPVRTRADQARYGLSRCVAGYILPENLVWWELERGTCCYEEVLIYERYSGGGAHGACWRHWTTTDSNAYDARGEWIPGRSYEHRFGLVPVRRVFVRRKHRCRNVGQSPYEATAELQKAIYNLHSERTLANVQQSHATLMAPQEYAAGGRASVGPGGVLPMFPVDGGRGGFQEWKYLDPPKTAQEELRSHILDLRDEVDRSAALVKPAGAVQKGTVAQSGLSKSFDFREGNDLLSRLAQALADAEVRAVVPLALAVLGDGPPDPDVVRATTVVYSKEFGLQGAQDVADRATELQGMAEGAGQLPENEKEYMYRHSALALPGMTEARQAELRGEIDGHVEEKARHRREAVEGMAALATAARRNGRAAALESDARVEDAEPGGPPSVGVDSGAIWLGGEPS